MTLSSRIHKPILTRGVERCARVLLSEMAAGSTAQHQHSMAARRGDAMAAMCRMLELELEFEVQGSRWRCGLDFGCWTLDPGCPVLGGRGRKSGDLLGCAAQK